MDESWKKLVFSFSEFSIYAHAALVLACIAAILIAHKIHEIHESAHAALVLACIAATLIAHEIHEKHELSFFCTHPTDLRRSAHAALVLASGMLTLGQPASCERSYAAIS